MKFFLHDSSFTFLEFNSDRLSEYVPRVLKCRSDNIMHLKSLILHCKDCPYHFFKTDTNIHGCRRWSVFGDKKFWCFIQT